MHLLNLKEVIYLTELGYSSIYKFMDEGHFPKSVSIGGRSVMWSESDVTRWMQFVVKKRGGLYKKMWLTHAFIVAHFVFVR